MGTKGMGGTQAESKPTQRDVIPWSHPTRNTVGSNKSWDKLTEEEPSPWASTCKGTAICFMASQSHKTQWLGVLRTCHSMPFPSIHWWCGQGDRPFAQSQDCF